MNRDILKGFVAGVMFSIAMLGGSLVFAHQFGHTGIENIAVRYDNIRISANGYEVLPGETVDGEYHEPFNYKGRVYVPLRLVAEALGKEVEWDSEGKLVNIEDPSYYNDEKRFISAFDCYSRRLDGAYSESYASRLGELYGKHDRQEFINVLSTYPKEDIDGIAMLLGYDLDYEVYGKKQFFMDELETFKNDKNLTSGVKYTIDKIMERLKMGI